jgi:4-phytase / acid phosphatase
LRARLATLALCAAAAVLSAQSPAAGAQSGKAAQSAANFAATDSGKLRFVVIVSRHGVRSPTGKLDTLNQYSRQPWPAWSVAPGYLTAHGAQLMTIFGKYDRELFAAQGLLSAQGCAEAGSIRIVADSDQRTRETGKALAAGIAPGCEIPVTALPEGTPDPLFHPLEAGAGSPDHALAAAAILGRIGGQPQELVEAYRPQLQKLDEILRGGTGTPDTPSLSQQDPPPASILSAPSTLAPGSGNHPAEFRSPLSLASTITENFLLEYTEGMEAAKVGWGHVDLETLRGLMQLHVANEDITGRTSYIARAQASNLLAHLLDSMRQAVERHPVRGALSKPDDRVLILVGHDTNLANIAGALGISWLIDGRRDDTPPGGALVFELWRRSPKPSSQQSPASSYEVRAYYTAQTLDQMRNSTPLTLADPPESVPVFLPGCSRSDLSCDWKGFASAVNAATDPAFVR